MAPELGITQDAVRDALQMCSGLWNARVHPRSRFLPQARLNDVGDLPKGSIRFVKRRATTGRRLDDWQ